MTDFGERRRTLPKTGQTTSYRDGDDGYYQKGWDEGERFKDVGDGTIIDNATGLMWPKDWAGDGANSGNTLNWNDAIDWALALDWAAHNDWRLPSIVELTSVTKHQGSPPYIYAIFQNAQSTRYYTSTTVSHATAWAWHAKLDDIIIAASIKTLLRLVVAVRNA